MADANNGTEIKNFKSKHEDRMKRLRSLHAQRVSFFLFQSTNVTLILYVCIYFIE